MKLVNTGEPGRFLPRGGQAGDQAIPGQQPHTGDLDLHMLYLPPPSQGSSTSMTMTSWPWILPLHYPMKGRGWLLGPEILKTPR